MSERDEIFEKVKKHAVANDLYSKVNVYTAGQMASLIEYITTVAIQIRDEALTAYKAEVMAVLDAVEAQLIQSVYTDEYANFRLGAESAINLIRERLGGKG